MDILKKYFHLTPHQEQQFAALGELYPEWNQKINVISRKDIGNLYEHHILHSMAIAKVINFQPGTRVMDIGTGGGFPGIPLAILFPETHFTLIDSIGKKIRVAQEVASAIGLKNVDIRQLRAEEEKGTEEEDRKKAKSNTEDCADAQNRGGTETCRKVGEPPRGRGGIGFSR